MAILLKGGTVATGSPLSVKQTDVLIERDLITRTAPNIEIPVGSDFEVVDCSTVLITPGFVNGHIHLNQVLNRGFLDDLSTEELLIGMHSRHDTKSDEDRYWASLLSIGEALRTGTTYFSAFATSAGLIAKAMRDSGIRGTLTIARKDQWWGSGRPPAKKNTLEIFDELRRGIQEWLPGRIAISIGAASDRSASEELLKGVQAIADETGLRMYMHVAEGAETVELSLRHRGCRPVEFLNRIGFLGSNLTLIHACQITESEIEAIARAGATVCHCPISNAKTAAGMMPLQNVRDAGVAVCLGTDAAATGNTNNVLIEAYLAALLHRAIANRSDFPTSDSLFSCLPSKVREPSAVRASSVKYVQATKQTSACGT